MTPTELRAVLLERLPADPRWVAWVEGVVERVGTVEDPRIARIAALCDELESEDPNATVYTSDVRAVLGEVQPTPPHGIDRDGAAIVEEEFERVLTDSSANIGWVHELPVYSAERLGHLRRIILERLALVRPVEGEPLPLPGKGVWISVEDAARAHGWYTRLPIGVEADDVALAIRLRDAAS